MAIISPQIYVIGIKLRVGGGAPLMLRIKHLVVEVQVGAEVWM